MTSQDRVHPTVRIENEGQKEGLLLAVHHTTLGPVHICQLVFAVQGQREGRVEGDRLQLGKQGDLRGRNPQNSHIPILRGRDTLHLVGNRHELTDKQVLPFIWAPAATSEPTITLSVSVMRRRISR